MNSKPPQFTDLPSNRMLFPPPYLHVRSIALLGTAYTNTVLSALLLLSWALIPRRILVLGGNPSDYLF